jgi:NADH:ubiquinone oxidoreductase subunit 2 (subunit N)
MLKMDLSSMALDSYWLAARREEQGRKEAAYRYLVLISGI